MKKIMKINLINGSENSSARRLAKYQLEINFDCITCLFRRKLVGQNAAHVNAGERSASKNTDDSSHDYITTSYKMLTS